MCKGLIFSLKTGLIECSEFLLPFELFFRDIKHEDLCNEDMSLIKSKLDTALTLQQNFFSDQDAPENQTPSEFKAFKYLAKSIAIQKADLSCDLRYVFLHKWD